MLEHRAGQYRQAKAFCSLKTGLLEVALPHNRFAGPAYVLAVLAILSDDYELGALQTISVVERHSTEQRERVIG